MGVKGQGTKINKNVGSVQNKIKAQWQREGKGHKGKKKGMHKLSSKRKRRE